MGIGSIAIRDHAYTYFSRSSSDKHETGVLKRTFTLDTCMKWSIWGKPSGILTRWIESGINAYMRFPRLQGRLMLPIPRLRSLLCIHPFFETISPRGKVTFTYQVTENQVDVSVRFDMPVRKRDTLCLLNELSAAWFTAGWTGGVTSPPFAWERVSSDQLPVSFVDQIHGIRFFIDQPSVNPSVPFTLYQGREYNRDLCWAGFCIQIGPLDESQAIPEVQYRIGFTGVALP